MITPEQKKLLDDWKNLWPFKGDAQFILATEILIAAARADDAEIACRILDDVELHSVDHEKSVITWMEWKHIRNKITDKITKKL